MAYTYDDFVGAAQKAGMYDQFGDDDLKLAQQHPEYGLSMLSLKGDYGNAKTDEQRLLINETANQLRNSYANKTPAVTTPAAGGQSVTGAGLNVGGVPTYQGGFTWDAATDPSMQAYRKQYLREGDRATANALGQASAASAGRPSSYAIQTATQQGDYYAGQLADKVPSLYQQAYERHLADRNAEAGNMKQAYDNLIAQITGYGYMPGEDELAQAGMTKDLADKIYQSWIMQNPDAAYIQGAIDPEQYYAITGKWPKGYSPAGTGGAGNDWWKDYAAVRDDPNTTSGAVNGMIMAGLQQGKIDADTAKRLMQTGMTRQGDKVDEDGKKRVNIPIGDKASK